MSSRSTHLRWTSAAVIGCVGAAAILLAGGTASAAIVPTVPLATAANYAVLAGSTVTNTGPSVLNGSLGLWPGTSVTGFPPGTVVPPATTNINNAAAQLAQSNLTAAYNNAAGRPLNATTPADLANQTLVGGVYAGPSKGALSLTGPLTLDGEGNFDSVFIFQTNSTLITASSSTVNLINGAQECNVFWQVGSSATLGTGSVFVGNILALTSITVNNGVLVRGRALARNGAVTLNNDTFTRPTCAANPPSTTTSTTTPSSTTSTTTPSSTTSTTTPGSTTSTTTPASTTSTTVAATTTTTRVATTTTQPAVIGTTTTTFPVIRAPNAEVPRAPGNGLTTSGATRPPVVAVPRTGGAPEHRDDLWLAATFAGAFVLAGTTGWHSSRRRRHGGEL